MTLSIALLGHTGFVGSTLLQSSWALLQQNQVELFNSSNIEQVEGKTFDIVICAACPAQKYLANRDPEADWKNISKLQEHIKKIALVRQAFILISTIDVYTDASQPVDETHECAHAIEAHHAYGKHRFRFEQTMQSAFGDTCVVVRLPALFGLLLKKNYLFDLLNNNGVANIMPNTRFQWYDLSNLARDLETLMQWNAKAAADSTTPPIRLINLFPPAVRTADIIDRFFVDQKSAVKQTFDEPDSIVYDLRSRYSKMLWPESCDGYYGTEEQVWQGLQRFVEQYRAQRQQQ
jgi:nucleoside-diphosphate-sugar epimerase